MNLVFCDCEATGLDEGRDHLLEIALVAVELPTFRVVATYDSVIVPPQWPTVKRNLPERVRDMHEASGLLASLGDAWGAGKRDYAAVEAEALAFVRQHSPHTPTWKTPLAGANPDFDRRFLRKRMPRLHEAFHYRNFDVRSITQLQDWVFGAAHVESPHRALPDALKAVADVREFLGIDAVVANRPRGTWGTA